MKFNGLQSALRSWLELGAHLFGRRLSAAIDASFGSRRRPIGAASTRHLMAVFRLLLIAAAHLARAHYQQVDWQPLSRPRIDGRRRERRRQEERESERH